MIRAGCFLKNFKRVTSFKHLIIFRNCKSYLHQVNEVYPVLFTGKKRSDVNKYNNTKLEQLMVVNI
jgi:hypothetical protein